MNRNRSGQEAIEFILISVLVFFGGLFAIMTFGGKMADFFTSGSSFAQVANQKTNVISANTSPDFKTNLTTTLENEQRTNVDTYEALKNPDGSVSIDIKGQVVNLEAEDFDLLDTVFETSGSDGTELISAISQLVQEAKSTTPGDIPIEISFGQGDRSNVFAGYTGTASVNTILVKAKDKLIIYQKDQTCTGQCSKTGTYRIEGTVGGNNTFTSTKVEATLTDGTKLTGNYNGSINTSKGLSMSGTFIIPNSGADPYNWDIDFNTLKQL